MDHSAIDLDLLSTLPIATLAPRYHVQEQPGNGCYGDAPGYPSYFTRTVYTEKGNIPARGPTLVIRHPIDATLRVIRTAADENSEPLMQAAAALLHRLWLPLPPDHPRVQAWQQDQYRHQHQCYRDDDGTAEPPQYGRPGTVIYPVPEYRLRRFVDDTRFSDAWRVAEQAAVAAHNAEIERLCRLVAHPRNHGAFRTVQRFYPDAQPRLDLIAEPGPIGGSWWETDAVQPTPETCRPRTTFRTLGCAGHPLNGTWCQWCGWHAEEVQHAD